MHPLRRKLAQLRGRLRHVLLLYGVAATVAAVVLAMSALGTVDYVLRLRDPGVRLLSSLGFLAVVGWVGYRCLWLTLSTHLDDAALALRLKRRFPELGDQLACALEFLDQPDDEPTAGSASLRRAVIDSTWSQARVLDFPAAIDPRAALRVAGLSLGMCLAGALLATLDPVSAQIAVARLANPIAPPAWPRQTHLEFRNPVNRVARGQAFEVEVHDRGDVRLPDDLQIEYRLLLLDGTTTVQREPMRQRDKATAFARRESVTRPFAYRAVGGDDDSMPWIEVEVADPPAIEELAMRLTPPKYTGYPPRTGEKHLRVLEGTTLAISGRVNKPLRSLVLHLGEEDQFAAALDEAGLDFRIPTPAEPEPAIDASGTYWFELVDREGLRSETPPWELQAVSDPPPSVAIEQPSASLFVTPTAELPVRVAAKDNLAVRRIWLRHTLASGSGPQGAVEGELVLFEGTASPPPPTNGKPSPLDNPGDHRVVETRWALGPLGLKPGAQLILTATADDYQPAAGESPPVRLSIITRRELEDRIAARQNLILAELRRALDMQRSSRSQVAEQAMRLEELEQLARTDVDHLQAAELTQRRIERDLTGHRESVPGYVAALLTDLENNQVDSPDVRRRMKGLLVELDALAREHLPSIRHALTTAIKSAQAEAAPPGEPWPANPAVAQSLVAAGEHQDRVIDTLERILEDLGRWDDYRRFYREIGRLLRAQEELGTRTAESGRRTMGRDPRDLPPADIADLRVLAAGQIELARQLDRLGAEMDQAAGQLDATDPLAADTIAHAVDEVRRRSLSGLMRTGSGHLEQNRIGQAVEVQQGIREALQDVLDILANRREHELERLFERLGEMETELADLLRRQVETTAGFRTVAQEEEAQPADPAETRRQIESRARQQTELADDSARTARRLERLAVQQAAQSVVQAGDRMGAAGRAATAGSAGEAAEQAEQAQALLELASRQLTARRRQAQAELLAEQLARLEDAVKHLHDSQDKVINATQQLDQRVDSPDGLSRAHLADLNDLVRRQLAVQNDTEQLRRKLIGAEAVQLVLDGAAGHMAEAAARLGRQQTDRHTQQAEILARDRLAMLIEAYQTDAPDPAQDPAGGAAGTGAEADGAPMGEAIAAAEVKLLKLLQQDVNRRTVELAPSAVDRQSVTEARRDELNRLVVEQGRLADLTLGLLAEPAEHEDESRLAHELGQAAVSEDAHPLLAISQQMRDVQVRLAQEAADAQTIAMQEQIVTQLDTLLQQARSQASSSAETARQAPPAANQQPSRQPDGQPGSTDRDPRQAPARESTDEPGSSDLAEQPRDQRRSMQAMERLWNQLPQRQREQLLQMAPEQFLPKYESQIEQYFRRLSEEQP